MRFLQRLSDVSLSMKTGVCMDIFYPHQQGASGLSNVSPHVVAGSVLPITVSMRVYDEYVDVRSLTMLFQG
jgi:hypothetical protein